MALNWERRSIRLEVATTEDGRIFRIEKNQAANNVAGYTVREVDSRFRDVQREPVPTAHRAKKVAQEWADSPMPTAPPPEPIRTKVTDLTLGLGRTR